MRKSLTIAKAHVRSLRYNHVLLSGWLFSLSGIAYLIDPLPISVSKDIHIAIGLSAIVIGLGILTGMKFGKGTLGTYFRVRRMLHRGASEQSVRHKPGYRYCNTAGAAMAISDSRTKGVKHFKKRAC